MARDFWARGFDSQSVTNAAPFSLVLWNPRHSTAVLETFWRRRCPTGGKAASLQQPDDVFIPPSLPLSRNNFRRCVGAFDEDPLTGSQGMTPAAFQLRRLARFFEDRPTSFRRKRLGCT